MVSLTGLANKPLFWADRFKSVLLEGGEIAAGSIPKLVRVLLREIRQRSPDAGA
jgi:hypothetical protein